MLWNYFGKPDDDLHDLNLGNFFLIQFHAPAQEYVLVFWAALNNVSTRKSLATLRYREREGEKKKTLRHTGNSNSERERR
ncbi:hypothetical protein CFP56_020855 [Quercus suber]|uniref:Uncharacterized protein n=1 Tax=Quercus suber TaxID=58331 RepID=A0AAW0KEC3_QUESU